MHNHKPHLYDEKNTLFAIAIGIYEQFICSGTRENELSGDSSGSKRTNLAWRL